MTTTTKNTGIPVALSFKIPIAGTNINVDTANTIVNIRALFLGSRAPNNSKKIFNDYYMKGSHYWLKRSLEGVPDIFVDVKTSKTGVKYTKVALVKGMPGVTYRKLETAQQT